MTTVANHRSRVCIVDDEPGVRDLLELVCASAGVDCATFGSAEDFLAEHGADGGGYALMLLDIDLPGIDGLALLQRLATGRRAVPVVMISGGADTAKVARARQLGAADFFAKPFDVQVIRQRISELVQRP